MFLFDDKKEDIKVSVVNSFKLLGVTIGNKLKDMCKTKSKKIPFLNFFYTYPFVEHCSNFKKIINKKLYSIKRLFFLCTSVKIHFFKTFILPYFDYGLSLIIIFPPSAYQSLNNCFNLCLYKLFKFKPEFSPEDEEANEEKIMSDFIDKLHSYDLFTLESRIYNKHLLFTHCIKSNKKSPVEIQALNDFPAPADEPAELIPSQGVYELRRGRTLVKSIIPETEYETLTFKHFFPKLLRTFKSLDFSLKKDSFRTQINLELKENLKTFLEKLPKFDIKYSAFFRKKKKLIKPKRNKNK